VLIMTRWHEDDLAGWLLTEQANGGEQWDVLSIPAFAEANDPLGRAVNEPLWPEWFTEEMWTEARRDVRRWISLYQQRPAPDEGDYFRRDWLKSVDSLPAESTMHVYGASDYAVTSGGGDYTCHVVVGIAPDERMYLLDVWRQQAGADVWVESWCDLVRRWKPLAWAEEAGQIKAGIGPFRDKRAIERKAFTHCRTFPTRGDKAIRAQSIRGRMAMSGLHYVPGARWEADLVSELLAFPAGKFDDQVDALGLVGQLLDDVTAGVAPKSKKPPERGDYRPARDDAASHMSW
jgi:predicted phage terminase large subunit-like protein